MCKRENGKSIDIQDTLDKLTQGFLWGFSTKNEGMDLDLNKPKMSQISKRTLNLKKNQGGTNLLDYRNKMKCSSGR